MKYSLKKVDEDAVAGFGDYSYSYDDPPVSESIKTSEHFLTNMLERSEKRSFLASFWIFQNSLTFVFRKKLIIKSVSFQLLKTKNERTKLYF